MTPHSHISRGLTLIEVLMALTVLTIGLTGAMASVVYASGSLARSVHVGEATMLAQSLASALASVPYTAQLAGNASPFADTNAGNNGDIADSALLYAGSSVPTGSSAPDHAESELAGSSLNAMVTPLPTGGTTYERYWNIAPQPSGNGVVYAVIVRWKEGGGGRADGGDVYLRTIVVGTRFQP
jgi:prepilin-type N-terminal cleavage/methylation domain-containing protein